MMSEEASLLKMERWQNQHWLIQLKSTLVLTTLPMQHF